LLNFYVSIGTLNPKFRGANVPLPQPSTPMVLNDIKDGRYVKKADGWYFFRDINKDSGFKAKDRTKD